MKDKLTILTTTHYKASLVSDKNYPYNLNRSNKTCSLISYMINNLYAKLGSNDITHYISLDHDPGDDGSCEYLENLNKLTVEYPNIKLIVTENGLRNSIINLINSVETDYFLWFEHDWEFQNNYDNGDTITDEILGSLILLMNEYDKINYIRFNKRTNKRTNFPGIDTFLKDYNYNVGGNQYNLCVTNGWSNTPYLARTSNWLNNWIPLLGKEICKSMAIELELQYHYRNDIKKLGLDNAIDKWGIYIYGNIDHIATVKHLNGKNL